MFGNLDGKFTDDGEAKGGEMWVRRCVLWWDAPVPPAGFPMEGLFERGHTRSCGRGAEEQTRPPRFSAVSAADDAGKPEQQQQQSNNEASTKAAEAHKAKIVH